MGCAGAREETGVRVAGLRETSVFVSLALSLEPNSWWATGLLASASRSQHHNTALHSNDQSDISIFLLSHSEKDKHGTCLLMKANLISQEFPKYTIL